MTIADKLQALVNAKQSIKQALVDKGVEVSDADGFADFVDKIDNIQVGSSDVAGLTANALFKVDENGRLEMSDNPAFVCTAKDLASERVFGYKFQKHPFSEISFSELEDVSGYQALIYAFSDIPQLIVANFSKLESISGGYAFGYAFIRSGLQTFNAPKLKTIGGTMTFLYTFSGTSVTMLDFPLLQGTIYHSTFGFNTTLRKIWIPKEVTTIKAANSPTSTNYTYSYSIVRGCSPDLVIYTDAPSKLPGWSDYCFHVDSTTEATVVYGATHEEFLAA